MNLITKDHQGHNVLGRYCWDCNLKTQSGIPGWIKAHNGPSIEYDVWDSKDGQGYCRAVIWKNGDIDRTQKHFPCAICNKHCTKPVNPKWEKYGDKYREMAKVLIQ